MNIVFALIILMLISAGLLFLIYYLIWAKSYTITLDADGLVKRKWAKSKGWTLLDVVLQFWLVFSIFMLPVSVVINWLIPEFIRLLNGW